MGNLADQLAAKFNTAALDAEQKKPAGERREATSTSEDPLARFAQIVQDATGIDPDEVDRSANLRADLGVSSLALVEVTVRCEDAFGVRLDDKTVDGFATVGDFLDYLGAHAS